MQHLDMKTLKVTAIFLILSFAIIGTLWISGVINPEMAQTILLKTVAIITLVGLCFQIVYAIAQKPKDDNQPPSKSQGPNF
jgi:hypothetical protein